MKPQQEVSPMQTMKTLWMALFASQFIFTGALYFQLVKPVTGKVVVTPFMAEAISALALIALGLAVFIPRTILKSELRKMKVYDETKALQIYQTAFIMRLVLLESVTLFGFALAFIKHDMSYFYPYLTVALLGYIMNYPDKMKILKICSPR